MPNLVNTLSWSISRAELFAYCKRKYYFSYYEYWNGWDRNETERKRLIYFLKKKTLKDVWVGNVVHNAIKYSIQNIETITLEYILTNLHKRLHKDFDKSISTAKENYTLKELWLYEHYKAKTVNFDDVIEKATNCVNNFFENELFFEIKQAYLNNAIIYLDDGDINKMLFMMENIPIYAIPDLCYKNKDGSFVIIDWKTGICRSDNLSLQLKMYALRLALVDRIDPKENDVTANAIYLLNKEKRGRKVTIEDISEIKTYAKESFLEMKDMLINIEQNLPLDEPNFPMTEDTSKCRNCLFQEVCYS
jgi:hypothetical protein